jgi:hypothetical protein
LPTETRKLADEKESTVGREKITIRDTSSETLAMARWNGNTFGLKEWYFE